MRRVKMALAIGKLKGMTPELEAKLKARGLATTDDLFEAALTPKGREDLAAYAGVPTQTILELANRADLARIKGIAGVYSDLLEEAGVDTVKELRGRVPENLHAKLLEVNTQKRLTAQPPALKTVKNWVSLARRRRKFLQY
jgi:predicted flap endonuclease-1-like 5' DNA nuclease